MCFEIRERDLLARIGRLKTKSGSIETPVLFPVINPAVQPIPPKEMAEKFGCNALITNAYIIRKHYGEKAIKQGIHRLLGFDGVIMTDSGAYQILVYGDIEVKPEEIVDYQEKIGTDIAVILDIPTGWNISRKHAEETVKETLARAEALWKIKSRNDILWVGPVQGGKFLDLISKSAKEIGKLPFEIHALGSPTPVMEQYQFDMLVDMIMAAKMNLPLERPLHLFGAGHPFMFSLAIALGCDMFDSAAYAIYARENRYMTEYGTFRLEELEWLPCSCPVCVKHTAKELRDMPKNEREKLLAEHNLHVCFGELRRIRQAIVEGRLWEYLELRCHSHPALLKALKKLGKYANYLEKHSPITKESGLFYFSHLDLARPEVVRHRRKILNDYSPPENAKILVLLPQTKEKPFHRAREQKRFRKIIKEKLGDETGRMHVCTYAAPFGIVPDEIDEVYPLSQHEVAVPLDTETIKYVAEQVASYIRQTSYEMVFLLENIEDWKGYIEKSCRNICERKGIKLFTIKVEKWDKAAAEDFANYISEILRKRDD